MKASVFGTIAGAGHNGTDAVAMRDVYFTLPGIQELDYDTQGNLLSDGQWNYEWNARNRLVKNGASLRVGSAGHRRWGGLYGL